MVSASISTVTSLNLDRSREMPSFTIEDPVYEWPPFLIVIEILCNLVTRMIVLTSKIYLGCTIQPGLKKR